MHVRGVRCPFCRSDVASGTEHVVCQGCLVRHHADCWTEAGRCASCAGGAALIPAERTRRQARAALVAAGWSGREASRALRWTGVPTARRDLVCALATLGLFVLTALGVRAEHLYDLAQLLVLAPIAGGALALSGRRLVWALVPTVVMASAAFPRVSGAHDGEWFLAVLIASGLAAGGGIWFGRRFP